MFKTLMLYSSGFEIIPPDFDKLESSSSGSVLMKFSGSQDPYMLMLEA